MHAYSEGKRNMKHAERMDKFGHAGLYFVTSENMSLGRSTLEIVQAALSGGARLIQLREKHLPAADLLSLARAVRKLTAEAGALLIINDRIDIAMASGADGVHLGQADLPVADARRLADDLIIGASTHSVSEAVAAESAGASYINIGPIFPTGTKEWQGEFLGLERLKEISASVRLPFTVMGGIKRRHIPELLAAGARTIALVTEVTQADDPELAIRELLSLIQHR